MAEYIEREKVYKMLNSLGGCGAEPESWADGWDKAFDEAIRELDNIPAADVRPERHAHWEIDEKLSNGYIIYKCSDCGSLLATKAIISEWACDGKHDFCGACGARMDNEGDDENG